jgi:trigger factor
MKHSIEKISPSRVKISVDVDEAVWKSAQEKAFDKAAQKVSVPGFRQGKAPKALLKERVSQETVWNDAIEDVLNPVYAEVIGEEKLAPFYRPDVSVSKLSDAELSLAFEVTLAPEVKLGDYKGIKIKKEAPSVTDQEVSDAIGKLLEGNATMVLVDRPIQNGDSVTLDFEGFIPDETGALKPFEGGKADNYALEIGSHSFVPGFEEALIGLKAGDRKDIKVTFPAAYVKDLAGKEATFKVTIHEVKEKKLPPLTDEAAKQLGIKDVDDVAKLQAYEKAELLKEKVAKAEDDWYEAVIEEIVRRSAFVIDEAVIDSEAAAMEENLKKEIEKQGLTFEQYLSIAGTKEDDLKKTYKTEAERNIKAFLVTNKIAEAERIAMTDADVEAEIKKLAEQYKMKEEDIRKAIGSNLEDWKGNWLQKKIRDFIMSVNS